MEDKARLVKRISQIIRGHDLASVLQMLATGQIDWDIVMGVDRLNDDETFQSFVRLLVYNNDNNNGNGNGTATVICK